MIDVGIICYLIFSLLREPFAASMWWYQILQEAFFCGRPPLDGPVMAPSTRGLTGQALFSVTQ